MNKEDIIKLLDDYKENKIDLNGAISQIKSLPYADLGYAKIDHHRAI
ncbi:1-(5-phosphoribosyl)-5-amino-4-imidazole-carboxylate carboxylase, partial [Clostridium saudiense]|nr:1-(5-phosphoribosyl)-5-amino-4-imidazole-carboxylate carboxylase [Clostridium saudiense]